MNDPVSAFAKWLEHNRYTVLGAVVVLGTVFYSYGCKSQTTFQGDVVTRAGLEQRVIQSIEHLNAEQARLDAAREALMMAAESAESDLDAQDEQRQALVSALGNVATELASGTLNPVAAITGAVSLAGLVGGAGFALDNRRKNSVIRKLRNGDDDAVDSNSPA